MKFKIFLEQMILGYYIKNEMLQTEKLINKIWQQKP